ncbi:hypothetical protein GSI_00303 [Ganoderma sinense ZZ0214-1]|uniref:Uncharacterized protein n=1 Tax=Ganoderma sinense ZZ0214-1 TaxID=1077348 RepID=A0A2G8SS87_9APHY|nr:hypothetical protein GSI_00303 [Ganoderma sinense ZZ0214-1]
MIAFSKFGATVLQIRNPDLNSSFYVVVFIGPASTILVNRFLIHIQEVNKYMIQGFCRSGDASMQPNNSSHELRFVRTSPQDRPTVIITPDPHDDDFVQLMDNTMYETMVV